MHGLLAIDVKFHRMPEVEVCQCQVAPFVDTNKSCKACSSVEDMFANIFVGFSLEMKSGKRMICGTLNLWEHRFYSCEFYGLDTSEL